MADVARIPPGKSGVSTTVFGNPINHLSSKVTGSKGCSRVIDFMLETDF